MPSGRVCSESSDQRCRTSLPLRFGRVRCCPVVRHAVPCVSRQAAPLRFWLVGAYRREAVFLKHVVGGQYDLRKTVDDCAIVVKNYRK